MQIAALILFIAATTTESAAPKIFTIEGKQISVTVDALDPAVDVTPQAGSKVPAVATYLAYVNALAAGSIKEAAALTSSPAKTTAKQNAYLERLGGVESFKASYAASLKENLKLTHVITKGKGVLILGQHPEHGPFATFLQCTGAKCVIADKLETPALADLAKVFGALREGKITL